MTSALSHIAMLSPFGLRQDLRFRPATEWGSPWGLGVHTTGRGLADRLVEKLGREPTVYEVTAAALEYYARSPFPPGYVIGPLGRSQLYQVTGDDRVALHIGGGFRDEYLSGRWEQLVSPALLEAWRARWPGRESPQHLFPGPSANEALIGVELVPTTHVADVEPAGPGETFTLEQYDALSSLSADLEVRHGWPNGWRRTARLGGHEDYGPLGRKPDGSGMHRFDAGGGWDPGALRDVPRFRWDRIGGR
jgi:hypothetical protein